MRIIIISILFLIGCTDTEKAAFSALGNSGTISCYSGGRLIFEGSSTGKIGTVSSSDGWEFKDRETGKFIRVSGDCLIQN